MKTEHGHFAAIIAGGGPAGLAAAIAAARTSPGKVLLLEQMAAPGRKLLASGGGRCNVTNILDSAEMAAAFGSKERFVKPALYGFSPAQCRDFFAANGVPLTLADGFHYFPESGKAASILHSLLDAAAAYGAEIRSSCRLCEVLIRHGKCCGVITSGGEYSCDRLIIACGGKSYPQLGATGSGYTIAAAAGHTIIPPLPAMTGVHTAQQWCAQCAGIALEDVETSIALPGEKERCRGELIFTDAGISAFAVLDISGRISELLQQMAKVPLKLNLFAGKNSDFWQQEFDRWRKTAPTRSVVRALNQYMPRKLAGFLVPDSEVKLTNLTKTMRREIITNLTALPLDAIACPWEKAMVTRGGVATAEIDPHTLESKIVRNLFFAGEVIDVDGPCGGYNIQWALSSGFTAGTFRQ